MAYAPSLLGVPPDVVDPVEEVPEEAVAVSDPDGPIDVDIPLEKSMPLAGPGMAIPLKEKK